MWDFDTRLVEKGFKSKDELARKLLNAWLAEEPGAKLPQPRSIGAKLGELASGKTTWWESRAGATKVLAGLLDCEPGDLGIGGGSERGARRFPFRDFPQLPALDPWRDEPCEVGRLVPMGRESARLPDEPSLFRWFRPTARKTSTPSTWVQLPPGGGMRLVCHWHRVRGWARVEELSDFGDARDHLEDPSPLVLGLREPVEPPLDHHLLERLRERPNTLILAHAPLPLGSDAWWSLAFSHEDRTGNPHEQLERHGGEWWDQFRLVFDGSWTERFVTWAAARLADRDSILDPKALLQWLRDFDPTGEVVATPGDLLPFLALAHEEGERGLKQMGTRKFTRRWARARIEREATGRDQCAIWLRDRGVEALETLVTGRFTNQAVSWQGGLSAEQWAKLLPDELAPTGDDRGATAQALHLLADEPNAERRHKRADALHRRLPAPSPRDAVAWLHSTGLLERSGGGRLAARPHWLVQELAREQVGVLIEAGDTPAWGCLALGADRQPLVESVLAHLSNARFLALVEQVVAAFDPNEIGHVAAVEQLFGEVARRLGQGWTPPPDPLHRLWACQLDCLVARIEGDVLAPIGRHREASADARVGVRQEWLRECWTWSLRLPAPEAPVPESLGFLFAGWAPSASAAGAFWTRPLAAGPAAKDRRAALDKEPSMSLTFIELVRLGCELAQRMETPQAWSAEPDALLPGFLLYLARQGGDLPGELVSRFLDQSWGVEWFLEHGKLTAADSGALAGAVWDHLVDEASAGEGTVPSSRWLLNRLARNRRLAALVLDGLEEDRFTASLVRHQANLNRLFAGRDYSLMVLPPRLRNALARWLARPPAPYRLHYIDLADRLGPEDVDGVLAMFTATVAEDGFEWCRYALWQALWRLAPDRARAETERVWAAAHRGRPTPGADGAAGEGRWGDDLDALFGAGPALAGDLLDLVGDPIPDDLAPALHKALRQVLPGSGPLAVKLHPVFAATRAQRGAK